MGSTTFSGPIKAGSERNDNIGYVKMVQSSAVTQAASTTTITIPAGSHIVSAKLFVTTVWEWRSHHYGAWLRR
jgi:hypothetical protein